MISRRSLPIWLGAAASILLHVVLIASVDWPVSRWRGHPEPPVVEVRLVERVTPLATAPRPATPPPATPPPKPRVRPPVSPEPVVEEPVAEEPVSEETSAQAPAILEESPLEPTVAEFGPSEPAGGEAAPLESPSDEAASEAVAGPALNPLPDRIDLQYRVRIGPASGRQSLVWVNEGGRYTITSVTAATGFASIVYSGRLVQMSRGRIGPRGLVPEEFWDQRGDRRASARFDPEHGALTLTPAKGEPRHFSYEGSVQDVLSLLFQLALTAPPDADPLAYKVFNGKKLRDYAYEVRGEESLETALGPLRTMHLARRTDGDGRFEVWLAIDRHYLPVRVLKVDDGMEGELTISAFQVSD